MQWFYNVALSVSISDLQFRRVFVCGNSCLSMSCMRGSRNFRQGGGGGGGGPGQLILQKSNGQFQRNLSFFKVPEGIQHFPGGSNFFQGGVQLLISYRNLYNLCFSGGRGSRPPVPPIRTSRGYSNEPSQWLVQSIYLKIWPNLKQIPSEKVFRFS